MLMYPVVSETVIEAEELWRFKEILFEC